MNETLNDWSRRTGNLPTSMTETGAVSVTTRKGADLEDLRQVTDYKVTEVSGSVVWLVPHPPETPDGSCKTPSTPRPKAFSTWVYKGVRFLCFPRGGGNVHVLDELGFNYGSWMSEESFRNRQKKSDDLCEAIGVCRLSCG
jgi:hypothetical protein